MTRQQIESVVHVDYPIDEVRTYLNAVADVRGKDGWPSSAAETFATVQDIVTEWGTRRPGAGLSVRRLTWDEIPSEERTTLDRRTRFVCVSHDRDGRHRPVVATALFPEPQGITKVAEDHYRSLTTTGATRTVRISAIDGGRTEVAFGATWDPRRRGVKTRLKVLGALLRMPIMGAAISVRLGDVQSSAEVRPLQAMLDWRREFSAAVSQRAGLSD